MVFTKPLLRLNQPYLWPFFLLVAANSLILVNAVPELRYCAALLLLAFLPGWVWLQSFFDRLVSLPERLILAVGLSLALTICAAIFAVYLPGPLTLAPLLITINLLSLAGLAVLAWRIHHAQPTFIAPKVSTSYITAAATAHSHARRDAKRGNEQLPHRRMAHQPAVIILVLLLLLAAALRLPRLGYAEFHEDEAEALMLGVRLLQGEDYALFLHRKGPAQMLLPVAFWLLTDHITESLARFPFALSSLLSVATLFILGQRWFNRQTGVIAGLLWAVNGYAIGFGRMVQYQALIFFLGPLALYCLYLAWRDGQPRWHIIGAILLAVCLLAHFDALLLLPAAGYLGWLAIQAKVQPLDHPAPGMPTRSIISVGAFILFLALLASFYVPYTLDPEFQNTTAYLAGSRVQPGLLYNNLDLLRRFDRDYSSHFYLPLLAFGLALFAGWQTLKLPKLWQWPTAGLILLAVSTFWLPSLWRVGQVSLAILPWLLLGGLYFWFSATVEARAVWLMFGVAFFGYLFLVSDPRTHIYILYPGAVLLAGAGWSVALAHPIGRYPALITGILLTGGITFYTIMLFLQTETALTQLRRQWDSSIWEAVYDDFPKTREYFGYPKREGWKAIGALQAQGLFPGDFRSVNEDFVIPIWYNYGQARSCYDTPSYFFVRAGLDGKAVQVNGPYQEIARISREGEIRLRLFSAGSEPAVSPSIYSVESLEESFDQLATPRQFTRQAEPSHLVGTQFGSAIYFVGYDLPTATVTAGDILHLNLYWLALQSPGDSYRVFVHLTDGARLWAQQDDDPACRLPTSVWRAGQRSLGQFRLLVNPDTPPGRYPLVIGLYQADTLERLTITGGAGQAGDDFLWLGDIEITH
jgi:hypothetical protein